MARKRKTPAPGRATKRNPMALALKSGLFQQKVTPRPDQPRKRPKHRERLEELAREPEDEE